MNDPQRYGIALFRAAIAYLAIVPLGVFLVEYVVIPLIVDGHFLPTSLGAQVAEFLVFFFGVVWGVPIVFPVVAILRSRTTHRAAWGAATAAVTIEAWAFILLRQLAFSVFGIGLLMAGAVFGYVASRIVEPTGGDEIAVRTNASRRSS